MSERKEKISKKSIIGWIVAIVVAVIGTFGGYSIANHNNVKSVNSNPVNNNNKNEQSIVINIDGKEVEINKKNAQSIYGEIESERDTLKINVDDLSKELEDYKQYGKDALVCLNPNYNAEKASLFSFDSVNERDWSKNEGSLKDSLGNTYDASLPYVVMGNGSYGEYYANGKFQKLKFTLTPHESMDTGSAATVKVMIDDDLTVLELENITRKSEPKAYSVDLKGAHFVKIICEKTSGNYDENPKIMVLDATLIK